MLRLVFLSLLSVALVQSAPGVGVFALYYSTSWTTVYLHYNPDNAGWNTLPGNAFGPSTNSSFPSPQWKYIEVAGNSVVFVLTDGSGQWDNNGGKNYQVSQPGLYSLQNSKVDTLETFTKGCAGTPTCSDHGTCDTTHYQCKCDSGYGGPDCSITCAASCSLHGTCDSSGHCKCNSGWASCGSQQDCSTDVTSDPSNCGKCGVACAGGVHVANATCSQSTCKIECDSGYKLCSDNTCALSCGLPGCNTYNDNQCVGDVIITPDDYEKRRWQTPARGEPGYLSSYQDFSKLQGHPQLVYSADHKSVTVTLVAVSKTSSNVSCMFDGEWSTSCSKTFTTSTPGPISVALKTDDASIQLDPVDFLWSAPAVNHSKGDYRNGQKGAIVEMFGWPHADIAKECAFAAQAGYLGVKVFPPQEQVMSIQPYDNILNPWYFMYQPVSYRLQGRMGTRDDLRNMIRTCRSLGVRVYADCVINHMTGSGNDADLHHRNGGGSCTYWPGKNTSASFPPKDIKTGSSFYETQGFKYLTNDHTGLPPSQEFPAVPYGPTDFHCERALNSWTDPLDLNAGWLTGLVDLNTEKENVQQRIADYLTDLLSIGFSGMRIDAAKHIQPPDLAAIFGKLKKNMGGVLPDDFISWLEVLLGGEADMLLGDPTSSYSYSKGLENALSQQGLSVDDIKKIKIWYSAYPKEPSVDNGMVTMHRKAIQNDDADQQNSGSTSRDMGDQGCVLVVTRDVASHRRFEVKLFQSPNGATDNNNDYPIRMVLSSYYVKLGSSYGIPDGFSDCSLCQVSCTSCSGSLTKAQAYQAGAKGYAGPVYTRVHRDTDIINAMRAWMGLGAFNESALAL